jgi:chromosomal replication initiator protein
MHHPPKVWDALLGRLRAEMPDFAFDAWIRPLALGEDSKALVLRAPNEFHRERVRCRYLDDIESLCAELGPSLDVRLEIGAAAERGPAEAPTAESAADTGEEAEPLVAAGASGVRPLPQAVNDASVGALTVPARVAKVLPPEGSGTDKVGPLRATGTVVAAGAARSADPQLCFPHSFDTFVVGTGNALAREASLAVAQGRQRGVNPLYLAGPGGSGKSHLARALVATARRHGEEKAVYVSAEGFTSQLMTSIQERRTESFRRRFRGECRLLVIEDVQFLQGKAATQLELFHTVEHLRMVGSRVVLTGDRLPREMPRLDARLSSQLTSGLVAEIEPPDVALRREILRAKASRGGVHIPDECLDLLADEVRGSVRDLEGVLIQLVTSASLLGRRIDRPLTEAALHKIQGTGFRAVAVDDVIACVSSFFGVTRAQLRSRSRKRGILVPRQLAMYLSRRYTDASLSEIGRELGRDYPAVNTAIQVVERAILERAPLRYQVGELVSRLDRQV